MTAEDCTITVQLNRDQALDLERRYAMHWTDEEGRDCVVDDATNGWSGHHPPEDAVTMTITFETSQWPRRAAITFGWDEDARADAAKAIDQMRELLAVIGVAIVDSDC